mmetsp:Transcript_8272/g.17661  ORF Transcript_8272/g.17661 Transcript_8272/m.17661 type:complete len:528 (+) Transcript_8272:195-1778(+)
MQRLRFAAAVLIVAHVCLPTRAFQAVRVTSLSRNHRNNPTSRAAITHDATIPRTNTRLFESTTTSAASKWMENEKRIEDEMDVKEDRVVDGNNNNNKIDETTTTAKTTTSKTTSRKVAAASSTDRWEELHGNFILRPPSNAQPRALIHFLGGALLGAAPQLTYRYLLERLSARGYLIVATPYQLSFDHLTTCDEIIGRFERVAPDLAKQYGAVPVVGVGHSCGSLLHMLITSLFPDTPRAANALISYNNRGVGEAVPLFEELIVPLFSDTDKNGSKLMKAAIEVAREQYNGEVPSDEAILKLLRSVPVPIPGLNLESILTPSLVAIPAPVRQSLTNLLTEPAYEALSNVPVLGNVPSLLLQSLEITQQIPKLIDEVEAGARDFVPTPDAMSSAARRAYRCRRTLLLQFTNDALDDSEILEGYLKEAESVMKMKRPMITIDLQRKKLEGNHLTPLLGPAGGEGWGEKLEETLGGVLDVVGGGSTSNDDVDEEDAGESKNAKAVRETLGYEQVERVVDELVTWLDEGSL